MIETVIMTVMNDRKRNNIVSSPPPLNYEGGLFGSQKCFGGGLEFFSFERGGESI